MDDVRPAHSGATFLIAHGTPEVNAAANAMLEKLIAEQGLATTTKLLAVAMTKLLVGILHLDTPEPELNIQTIEKVLLEMTERVSDHFECCRHNGTEQNAPTVN